MLATNRQIHSILTPVPRWTPQILGFLFLSLCTFLAWQLRFESIPGQPSLHLADLLRSAPPLPQGASVHGSKDQPHLLLAAGHSKNPEPYVVLRLSIPDLQGVRFLHLHTQTSSENLIPGDQPWKDGRIIIEWHHHGQTEHDYLTSIQGSHTVTLPSLVTYPLKAPATPSLRIEHLGHSGNYSVDQLEITAVRQTKLWLWGRFPLFFAWTFWALSLLRPLSFHSPRFLIAACAWTLFATQVTLPGPWRNLRPFFSNTFWLPCPSPSQSPHPDGIPQPQLPPPTTTHTLPPTHPSSATEPPPSATPPSASPIENPPPLGKLPDQGSIILRIKAKITYLRPILHSLLFFGPSLFFALLTGTRNTLVLTIPLAIAIELTQYAFGYGFDLGDGFDLLCNGTGITLGLLTATCLLRLPLARRLRPLSNAPGGPPNHPSPPPTIP